MSNNTNNNLADDMNKLNDVFGINSNSNNSNSNINSSNGGFDNNDDIVITDDPDEDELDNLVGAFDKAKPASKLTEDEVLLADPNLNNSNTSVASSSQNNVLSAGNNLANTNTSLDPLTNLANSTQVINPLDPTLSANNVNPNANSSTANNSTNGSLGNGLASGLNNGLPINNAALPTGNNVAASVKPGGKWNQRVVIVGVSACILFFSFVLHNTSGKTSANSNEVARTLPVPEANPRMVDPRLSTSELGLPDGDFPKNKPVKTEDPLPELTIPPNVNPAPVNNPQPTPTPSPVIKEVEPEPEDFSIKFRAANKLAAESLIEKNNSTKEVEEPSPLEGLRLPMQLIEPLRSGIPTTVSAVVIADVKDATGKTVVPKGSRAQLPFLSFEVQGRVSNDTSSNSIIVLPNNQKLVIKGTVKGTDGFAGLKGKVRQQSKGNILARTGRAVGRVGARIIGIQTGGVGGFVVEDAINESVNTSLPFIPSERVVEVMAGTPFTFNVN